MKSRFQFTVILIFLLLTATLRAQDPKEDNLKLKVIYMNVQSVPNYIDIHESQFEKLPTLFANNPPFSKFEANFYRARSQIQKALIVRDYLVPIVQSYTETRTDSEERSEALAKLDLLKSYTMPDNKLNSIVHPQNILFEFGENRFQVVGVDPTRLAVNTGHSIIFNGEALGSRSFSLEELFQIWMHEIFHLDPITKLIEKDHWISKVSQWVRDQTHRIDLENRISVSTMFLPMVKKNVFYPNAFNNTSESRGEISSVDELNRLEIQEHLLIIREDSEKTMIAKEIYNSMQAYRPNANYHYSVRGNSEFEGVLSWFYPESIEMKIKSNGLIQFTISQSTLYYEAFGTNYFTLASKRIGSYYSVIPSVPKETLNVFYNPVDFSTETQRTYSISMLDGDFEIQKISDTKMDRTISVRLNIPDSAGKLNPISSIHLLAKDTITDARISVNRIQFQRLSEDELLIDFKVPKTNLTLNQIMIPIVDSRGLYHELSLRPSKPQVLNGDQFLEDSVIEVKTFSVIPKKSKNDSMYAEIKLTSDKVISGITLEMDQIADANRVNWIRESADLKSQDFFGSVDLGRKFFIERKDIQIKDFANFSALSFPIPNSKVSVEQNGPRMMGNIGWAYHYVDQYKGETMTDTYRRQIVNAWIHFSDGSYQKIEKSKLPKYFSISKPKESKKNQVKYELPSKYDNWREYKKQFYSPDDVKDYFAEPSPLRCNLLFNPSL